MVYRRERRARCGAPPEVGDARLLSLQVMFILNLPLTPEHHTTLWSSGVSILISAVRRGLRGLRGLRCCGAAAGAAGAAVLRGLPGLRGLRGLRCYGGCGRCGGCRGYGGCGRCGGCRGYGGCRGCGGCGAAGAAVPQGLRGLRCCGVGRGAHSSGAGGHAVERCASAPPSRASRGEDVAAVMVRR